MQFSEFAYHAHEKRERLLQEAAKARLIREVKAEHTSASEVARHRRWSKIPLKALAR
ncbi:MAG: hypothetical protein KatS3mg060_1458 [Dehalococcoidia bacterium]|jgi:hypothetical protein|nr:MAG: hypothetical protein KatS3mg060_1458 [Dehalococcoidia bacterium]